MIDGSAMRRRAVKNKARPQAVAAIAAGARKLGPSRPSSLTTRPMRLADRLRDPADCEQQDQAGDRDEDVVEAGDEAKLLFVDRRRFAIPIEKVAKRRSGVGVDGPRRDGLVEILLGVHDNSSLSDNVAQGVLPCQYSRKGLAGADQGGESGAGQTGC